jgi:hypothetical protein
MEEIRLWEIFDNAKEKPKASPVATVDETKTEQFLEDVLTASPELLLPDLHLIGRQTETPGGPLDLLGVDGDGRLVVFELKRGKLTREAIAQAIDYASYLASLEPEELCLHINKRSGNHGTESIDDFAQWYYNHFQRPAARIGVPRVMLVGLGVDDRAKRMVEFLARCELDISLVTFHGFIQGGKTLLARQVEVQSRNPESQAKPTKLDNKVKLDKLLDELGIAKNYEALISALKQGLGDSAYQWPNPVGYSFYLRETTDDGGPTQRSYVALYAPEAQKGRVQIYLQARAILAATEGGIQKLSSALGSTFVSKPGGWGEIWIDGRKPPSTYTDALTKLGQAIAAGWKNKTEYQDKTEAEDAANDAL